MRKLELISVMTATIFALGACSGEESSAPAENASTSTPPPAAAPAAPPTGATPAPAPTPGQAATPAAAAGGAGVTLASLTGDAARGQRVFMQCRTCHEVQAGVNKVGPSLKGIVGRQAGTIPNFRYSTANKNSGITWTEDVMFAYLENPREYIPGTYMSFVGLRDPQQRADVIAYLKTQS